MAMFLTIGFVVLPLMCVNFSSMITMMLCATYVCEFELHDNYDALRQFPSVSTLSVQLRPTATHLHSFFHRCMPGLWDPLPPTSLSLNSVKRQLIKCRLPN